MAEHTATVAWDRFDAAFTDNRYSRAHRWMFDGGATIPASSSPHVVPVPMSDPMGVDPEEAFVASLSSCHMLWFLSIAAKRGFVVDHYEDNAVGTMARSETGRLAMTRVVLRPGVAFGGGRVPAAGELRAMHDEAHHECYLANSVRTEVVVEALDDHLGVPVVRVRAASVLSRCSGAESLVPIHLQAQFGLIDIYIFDQLLRGRIRPGMRVLDAGCGGGRNLVYLLREGFDVHAVDEDPQAVAYVREMAAALAPSLRAEQIRLEPVERLSFPDAWFDVVISNAVLHFAHDDAQFEAMVREMWRVLKPGGMLFARLASSIGMTLPMAPLGGRRYVLPDGSQRYVVDEAQLMALTDALGAELLDPIKTTVVQGQRCMTTWVMGK